MCQARLYLRNDNQKTKEGEQNTLEVSEDDKKSVNVIQSPLERDESLGDGVRENAGSVVWLSLEGECTWSGSPLAVMI